MKTFYCARYRVKRDVGEGVVENFKEGAIYFEEKLDACAAVEIENKVYYDGLVLQGEPEMIEVYEMISEYQKVVDRRLRENALRKLSPAEKRILGLPEK